MAEKRANRSDKYQHIYFECSVANDVLDIFSNDDSIHDRLCGPYAYNEELLDLQDQLKKEFWRIVDGCLTERQAEVIKLYADGYTQMEIAKTLKVNQSSIAKNIHGNKIYNKTAHLDNNNGINKSRQYGGSLKRIMLVVEEDQVIQDILKRIAELRTEKW